MTRNEQFKQELLDLLAKYDCELSVQAGEHYPVIEAYSRPIWDAEGLAKTRESIRVEFDDVIGNTLGK